MIATTPFTNHKGKTVFSTLILPFTIHHHQRNSSLHFLLSTSFCIGEIGTKTHFCIKKTTKLMALSLCASPKCKLVATPSMILETPSPSSRLLLPPLGSSSSKSSNSIKNIMASVTTLTSVNLRRSSARLSVRCSLETAGPTVTVGQVTEVNKDTFWPIVKAAGDKTVVLDMYTQWCGPCKVMAPRFQELSEKYLDVVFLKLDCNQENRPLAKELGIRVVPTFKILKDNKVEKEVTGAKFDDLVAAIEAVRSS